MVVRWKTFSTCYLSALSANKADVYGKNFNKLMICIYQWENYDVMTLKYDKLFDNIIWGKVSLSVVKKNVTPCQTPSLFLQLTLLHSERPKLHTILAFLSALGLNLPAYGNTCIESHFTGFCLHFL